MSTHSDFLHFFRTSEMDLRAYIGSMVRDRHACEDLFQEVSRTLWESFERYDPDRPFGAWARGVATIKMLEAKRKSARFPLLFPPETVEAVLEAFEQEEESPRLLEAALKLCLSELPPRSRQILTWRYELGYDCRRIARAIGANLKSVHQTLCRLRHGLEECIDRRISRDDFEPAALPDSSIPNSP